MEPCFAAPLRSINPAHMRKRPIAPGRSISTFG